MSAKRVPWGTLDIRPQGCESRAAIVIAPGWSEGPWLLWLFAQRLAKATGRRVVVPRHPRWARRRIDPSRYLPPSRDDEAPPAFWPTLWRKAQTIVDTVEALELDRPDLIGHSEGGINALMAAGLNPERFGRILLVASAGWHRHDTVGDLSVRTYRKNWLALIRSAQPGLSFWATHAGFNAGLFYALANPWRAYQEVRAIACTDTADLISRGHRASEITVNVPDNDPISPYLQVKGRLNQTGVNLKVWRAGRLHDSLYTEKGFLPTLVAWVNARSDTPANAD